MKNKALFILLALVLFAFSSCATYTIEEARPNIVYPPSSESSPTRLNEIEERKEAEKETIRKAEEERIRLEKEKAINTYPDNLSELSYPFYFNPVKNKTASSVKDELTVIFIPLGESDLSGSQLLSAANCISDTKWDTVALTGSLSNQTRFASVLGEDAVTMEGGTIVFRGSFPISFSEDRITLALSEEKDATILIEDQKPVLPSSGDTEEVLAMVEELEDRDIESIVEYVSQEGSGRKVFFLSSYAPSTSDWTDWTEYPYRRDQSFIISSIMSGLKWQDAFDATRFSVETDSGVTRRNGDVEERLDYIWSKGLIPLSCFNLPVETTEITAIVATFLLP